MNQMAFTTKAARVIHSIHDIHTSNAVAKMSDEALRTDDSKLMSGSQQVDRALTLASMLLEDMFRQLEASQTKVQFKMKRLEAQDFNSGLYAWAEAAVIGHDMLIIDMGFGHRFSKGIGATCKWKKLHWALADLEKVQTCRFVKTDA